MRYFFVFLLCVFDLSAQIYYAKVEPYELQTISSNVSGEVVFVDEDMLGQKLHKKPYIKIDDTLERVELQQLKKKMRYIENIVKLDEQMIDNYEAILHKKSANYKRVASLKIKSQVDKDREFYDLVSSQNQLLGIKKELYNLKVQLADFTVRKKQLEKTIADKNLSDEGGVLYALYVKRAQVVTPGMVLAKVADTSKALLTIYVNSDELQGIREKTVYIDGKKTPYKVKRVLNIADEKNISKYMAQIIIDSPKLFSKLVKIELRER